MARQDIIQRSITVDSPREKVWEAITAAEHLSGWFGDIAEIDLRPGGAMRVGWTEYGTDITCVVERVEHPTTFAYRWEAGTTDDGVIWTTSVEFTLDEEDGRTTITVLESGLSSLPDALYDRTLEENTSGWKAEFDDLVRYLASLATR